MGYASPQERGCAPRAVPHSGGLPPRPQQNAEDPMTNETIKTFLEAVSDALYSYILIAVLIGVGLYFFIRTKALPLRMFGESLRVVAEPPEKESATLKEASRLKPPM